MICRTCLFANNGHQREIARDFEAASKLARLSLSLPCLRPPDKGQANIASQCQTITGLIQMHLAAIHGPRIRIQNVPSAVCIALLLDVANDDETDDRLILAVIPASAAHMFFGLCFKHFKLQRAARVDEIMTRDSLVRPTPYSRAARIRRSVATRVASAVVARGVSHAQNERGIRGVPFPSTDPTM